MTTAVDPLAARPPHSIAAEEAVLGGVLLSASALAPLRFAGSRALAAEHFYRERHRRIFEAMCALQDRDPDVGIDVLTVVAELERRGTLEQAGGQAGVDALTGGVPSLGGIRRYAEIVVEHWVQRERLSAAYEQIAGVMDRREETWQAGMERAHAAEIGVAGHDGFVDPVALGDRIMAYLREPDAGSLPFPPELPTVARWVRLRPGHVTVMAAWPSHGKSAIGAAIAAATGKAGHRTVIWSNEDTEIEITAKHIMAETGIPASVIVDRRVTDTRMSKVVGELGRLPFGVMPCHDWSATQIAASIRQARPAVAIVDHFHNMAQIGKVSEIDEAIRVLAAAAGQTGCHLIIAAQLNRARLTGVCKPPPVAADLRGSGMFLAAAHTMLLLHRDEEEMEDPLRGKTGKAMQLATGAIDVAKNKVTGKTGVVRVTFDPRRLRFVEDAQQGASPPVSSEPF